LDGGGSAVDPAGFLLAARRVDKTLQRAVSTPLLYVRRDVAQCVGRNLPNGVTIIGTSHNMIDMAEDRER